MYKKINWIIWLSLVILWNYGFPQATPFQDVLVAVILSILFIIIQMLQSRYLKKDSRSKFENNEGALDMGIHYDYKSTRGDKAMKKEAKRKARIEQRRASDQTLVQKSPKQETMHDINKPITLEDLTNPDKN